MTEIPKRSRREVGFGLGLTVAGALFLFFAILAATTEPWQGDEDFSYRLSNMTPKRMIDTTKSDVHPPLFYLLLIGWRKIFEAPIAMRAMTICAGLLAVVFAAVAVRAVAGVRAAIIAALLLATFPQLVQFSQFARMYSFALAFEMIALCGWLAAPRRPLLGWTVTAGAITAAIYTHNLCLVFAAALWAGHLIEGFARSRQSPARFDAWKRQLPWAGAATAAVIIFYLPWSGVLWRQMTMPHLEQAYDAPNWASVGPQLIHGVYTLARWPATAWLTWAPGAVLLGVLPLAGTLLATRDGAKPEAAGASENTHPPAWIFLWLGLAPIVLLTLVSILVRPIFGLTNHSVLFTPFLLMAASLALVRFSRGPAGRSIFMATIACLCGLSFSIFREARHSDFGAVRDAMLDRAPLDSPIIAYPFLYSTFDLIWDPLPVADLESISLADTRACTLIVIPRSSAERREILDQVRLVAASAQSVRELYTSHFASAYYLEGLPPGALEQLMGRWTGLGRSLPERKLGDLAITKRWFVGELTEFCDPPPQLLRVNQAWDVARLAAERAEITLPIEGDSTAHLRWVVLGFRAIGVAEPPPIEVQVGVGRFHQVETGLEDFIVTAFVPASDREVTFTLQMPDEFSALEAAAAGGDTPDGLYLTWGAYGPLEEAAFRGAEFEGTRFDVGGLRDELFLRSGFHEREGMPPAQFRWTGERFQIELPVWEPGSIRKVVLIGSFPPQVEDRTMRMTLLGRESDRDDVTIETRFEKSGYGAYEIELPEPLDLGPARFQFEMDFWVPDEHGAGDDPRRLGFFLDAIGLL